MGMEMPKEKEYKDPNQLDIDFSGEISEGERAQIVRELKEIDPNFKIENLIEKDGEWYVLRLGKYFRIEDWKQEVVLDKQYNEKPKDDKDKRNDFLYGRD